MSASQEAPPLEDAKPDPHHGEKPQSLNCAAVAKQHQRHGRDAAAAKVAAKKVGNITALRTVTEPCQGARGLPKGSGLRVWRRRLGSAVTQCGSVQRSATVWRTSHDDLDVHV